MTQKTLGTGGMIYCAPAMPVYLIGANVGGKPNFLTAAWSGVACGEPLMLSVPIRHTRYTLKGIEENGTLSFCIPPVELVKETDFCGIVSGSKVDKVKTCGFEIFYGKLGNAPLIEQCPVNMECSVHQKLDLGSHVLIIAKLEEVHIADSCITDGKPDIDKMNVFTYTTTPAREYRRVGEAIAKAFSVGAALRS
jgi:flavin reductase (DIM6/NTAB) family NADH-FMN oxidoreductase RutF